MENKNSTHNYSSYYLVPGLICGMLTGYIATGSFGYTILGGILGLLTAGFWMNVVVKRGEEA